METEQLVQPPSPYLIQPTQRTQPYRNGRGRQPGAALSAMLAGRPFYAPNPMDVQRDFQGGLAALLLRLSPPGRTMLFNR